MPDKRFPVRAADRIMFASLPMYARPETEDAHNALWTLIRDGLRDRGIAAPDALDQDFHHVAGWGREDLVLGQICNLPYRALFRDRVTVIGSADYDLPEVEAGQYFSQWVIRADDPAQRLEDCGGYRLAYNDPLSQSGWGAAEANAERRGLRLTPHLSTGAHHASMQAVAEGAADLASIDAVTWRMAKRWVPVTDKLRVIGRTDSSPGMTFITRPGQDPTPYFAAIAAAIAELDDAHKATLGLRAIVSLPASAYDIPLASDPAGYTA